MAIDGLSLAHIGISREVTPAEIQLQAQEASNLNAAMKKISESERQQLDPNGGKNKERRQQKKHESDQQKAIAEVFVESSDAVKTDLQQYNQRAMELTENKSEYKVMYNSRKEIVEIVHIRTGEVRETLTLEELKGFVMRVKNPLGIIVDRKV